jgi:hypothetical protein
MNLLVKNDKRFNKIFYYSKVYKLLKFPFADNTPKRKQSKYINPAFLMKMKETLI